MAHAQKPDFVFRRNGPSPFKSAGASVQSTTGSRDVRISGSNAGYTMFRGSVKSTGYPLHSPVCPSLPLLCVTVCHHISTGLYGTDSKYLVSDITKQITYVLLKVRLCRFRVIIVAVEAQQCTLCVCCRVICHCKL
jgi:hypothetical protein